MRFAGQTCLGMNIKQLRPGFANKMPKKMEGVENFGDDFEPEDVSGADFEGRVFCSGHPPDVKGLTCLKTWSVSHGRGEYRSTIKPCSL
jgi:hypothetical protein